MPPAPSLDPKRRHLATVALALGLGVLAMAVNAHVSFDRWLTFHYLRAVALALAFSLCCLVAGHTLLRRVLGRTLPLDEHVALAFPLGVLCFYLTSFAFGMLGLYGVGFFLLGPALLLLLGWRASARTARRLARALKRRRHAWSPAWTELALLAFGLLGLAVLWLTILTPRNASVDARWYHLPIAEHYLARGAIRPFSEGWVPGAFPQLASLLYVWPFALPQSLFDHLVAAAHLEFAIFLFTLQGIATLVRRATGVRSRSSWTAIWLFPGIFCYDSGLVLGADHVAALWSAPLALLAWRYWRAPSLPFAALLGAVAAGALSTKYTAAILLPLPIATLLARSALDYRRRVPGALRGPALMAATLLLVSAPHWLKNLLFYGDPLFPALRHILPGATWSAAAEAPYRAWYALRAPVLGAEGALEMLKALATFAFVPHDFASYHGAIPVFGFLFTLLTPLLLLLRGARRVLWLFAAAYAGIACWFWLHQFDRYLQALVPWMAAGTAAVIGILWHARARTRPLLGALVGLQIAWGADVVFMPSHHVAGSLPKALSDLFASSYSGADRFVADASWEELGRALPPGAKVLVHEEAIHLGLRAQSVLDSPGEQGLLYWGQARLATPEQIWNRLREHGVTHVVWAARVSHEHDTVAGALAFFEFASRHTRSLGNHGGFSLAELRATPPPETQPGLVAYYACGKEALFQPGVYALPTLAWAGGDQRSRPRPQATPVFEETVAQSHYLVFDARCHGPLPNGVSAAFELVAARGHAMLLIRKEPP
jgi:hypothetical protein